jgi:3-oxoacyl-[acyl-carrier-protein] synthase II
LTNIVPPDDLPEDRPRVVVTGMGVVCSLGRTAGDVWDAVAEGRSGVGPITRFDPAAFASRIAAEVPDADLPDDRLDEQYWHELDRRSRFAVSAGLSAFQDAGIMLTPDNRNRFAVVMASERPEEERLIEGARQIEAGDIESAATTLAPHARPHAPAERIGALLGVTGPVLQVENRSAGGLAAIIEAAEMIRRGDVVAALAGGAEAPITPISLAAFQGTGALSERNDVPTTASRPLDRARDGFVLGEGAAVLVLESLELARARGATILAELEGYGMTFSASQGGHPATDSAEIGAALQRCLGTSGRIQAEIDVVALHAAGTVDGDIAEATGVRRIFGSSARHHLYTPALKSLTGHLLGASGPLSAVIMLSALEAQRIPGTINLDDEDDECDLDANATGTRDDNLRVVIVNATGWGHNAAILLTHPDAMSTED